jgi:hypothetical protein
MIPQRNLFFTFLNLPKKMADNVSLVAEVTTKRDIGKRPQAGNLLLIAIAKLICS